MVGGWIFLYGVPAAIGAFAFLKVVSNQVEVIERAVHTRAEELEIAAAKAMVEGRGGRTIAIAPGLVADATAGP